MKIRKHKRLIIGMLVILSIFSLEKVYATENDLKESEYSSEYKEYIELSDEEKQNRLEPLKYNVIKEQSNSEYLKNLGNTFKLSKLLKANLSSRYSLQDEIPDNVKIKNQGRTNACWTFASIAGLETNLAVQDKKNGGDVIEYDFSEKHMDYATARSAFINNEKNDYGVERVLSDGGSLVNAITYLTNGSGAIPEEELPFDNSQENIDISKIENKTISTTLEDCKIFASPSNEEEKQQLMQEMKQHIVNYGGIYAGIYGAQLLSNSYENSTGAIYCTEGDINHAVLIVGWDDNYATTNFKEGKQPTNKGAWIIKNSWGTSMSANLLSLKGQVYSSYTDLCTENGWNSASDVPDAFVLAILEKSYGESKVAIDGENVVVTIGNNGFMYVSYEDKNIYSLLMGIEKAEAYKNYYNLYQNDILGYSNLLSYNSNKIYLANVFKRDSSIEEALDRISIFTLQEYKCKVYVNPNGASKKVEGLQEIELKDGKTVTVNPGYATLEFATPIELTGEYFSVIVEVTTNNSDVRFTIESPGISGYESAEVNEGESFFASESEFLDGQWTDFSTLSTAKLRGNLNIKALTVSDIPEPTLSKIEIVKMPSKLKYLQNEEQLYLKGGTIKLTYSDDSTEMFDMNNSLVIATGFDNTKVGKQTITLTYKEKMTSFEVEIVENKTTETSEEENEKEAIPSNFDSAAANVISTEIYYYSQDIDNIHNQMKIKISNIIPGDKENKYTYYYYISGVQGEKNIKDWKIAKANIEDDGTYSITIDINSDNLQNEEEIAESDNLYVYIKEIAKMNNKQIETIKTLEVKNTTEAVIYVDGKKLGNTGEVVEETISEETNIKDNTVATTAIPQTGLIPIILIFIITVSVVGGISYYKFRNIDK